MLIYVKRLHARWAGTPRSRPLRLQKRRQTSHPGESSLQPVSSSERSVCARARLERTRESLGLGLLQRLGRLQVGIASCGFLLVVTRVLDARLVFVKQLEPFLGYLLLRLVGTLLRLGCPVLGRRAGGQEPDEHCHAHYLSEVHGLFLLVCGERFSSIAGAEPLRSQNLRISHRHTVTSGLKHCNKSMSFKKNNTLAQLSGSLNCVNKASARNRVLHH